MRRLFIIAPLLFLTLSLKGEILWECRSDSGTIDTAASWYARNGLIKPSRWFDGSLALIHPLDNRPAVQDQKNYTGYLRKIAPLPVSSFRFMFAFDSLTPLDTNLDRIKLMKNPDRLIPAFNLFMLLNDYYSQSAYLRPFLTVTLITARNRFLLVGVLRLASETFAHDTLEVRPGTPYCIETRLELDGDGKAGAFSARINNRPFMAGNRGPFNTRFREIILSLGNLGVTTVSFAGHLHFDDLALGRDFLGSPPRPPVIDSATQARSRAQTASILLYTPPLRPGPAPSPFKLPQYQIQYRGLDFSLPLYTSDTNQIQHDSILLDLALPHNTACLWRVRHFDSLGNVSDWSLPAPLTIRRDSIRFFRTHHPAVTALLLDGRDPLREKVTLRAGDWFRVSLAIDNPAGWSDLGYLIFWAHNAGYVDGNPYNRGGRFKAASSYIYNVSFAPTKAFEKRDEDQMRFTRLVNSRGLYIDFRDHAVSFDSVRKRVDFRARFLPEAAPGPWVIKGYVRNSFERSSHLYSASFRLLPRLFWRRHLRPVLLSLGILTTLLILWSVRLARRRKERPRPLSRSQEIFGKFEAFVNTSIDKDLDIEAVERHMGMTSANLRRFVQENSGKGIKQYILDRKLDHARGLLETTNLNITEVMTAAGFGNSAHFTQAFKKHTGLTPTDYRKKVRG